MNRQTLLGASTMKRTLFAAVTPSPADDIPMVGGLKEITLDEVDRSQHEDRRQRPEGERLPSMIDHWPLKSVSALWERIV